MRGWQGKPFIALPFSETKYVTFEDSTSSSTTSIARSFSRSLSAFLPGPAGGGSRKASARDDVGDKPPTPSCSEEEQEDADSDDDDGVDKLEKMSRVDNSPSSALAMVNMQLVKSAVNISGVVSF